MNTVIIGTGGFAREVCEILNKTVSWLSDNDDCLLGFLDDNKSNHGKTIHGLPVLGGIDWLIDNQNVSVVIGVGSPEVKKKIVERILEIGNINFRRVIDPSAHIGEYVEIGVGVIICGSVIVTTDVILDDFVTLNINSTVGHDCQLKKYVTVSPAANISGNVNVGEGTDIGTGTQIIQGLNIGEWSIVGAGTVVVKDVSNNVTVVGNPARVIKER